MPDKSNEVLNITYTYYKVNKVTVTTVEKNDKETIMEAVQELLTILTNDNDLKLEDIGAVIFSSTPDINAAFPAAAARRMGWDLVPLFGTQELDVPDGVKQCIRVLILWNTPKKQSEVNHAYLKNSCVLRPELSKKI